MTLRNVVEPAYHYNGRTTIVLEGTKIESGTIYGGTPARKIKDIPVDLITGQIDRIAEHYTLYASWFKDYNDVPPAK